MEKFSTGLVKPGRMGRLEGHDDIFDDPPEQKEQHDVRSQQKDEQKKESIADEFFQKHIKNRF